MKKVLSFILIAITVALITGGFLIFNRFQNNPEQIVPFPYVFESKAPAIALDAPILITGDRMGVYFSKFKEELASTISTNLAKPIAIQSMAKDGHALHRTLHELKSLTQWPQILIYQGASEEMIEAKFDLRDIGKIKENFKRYDDDRIETFLILYPWLSRIIYEPLKRIALGDEPVLIEQINEEDYLKRLETNLMLFEQQLIQLVNLSKDRSSLLILTTTPINLDVLPHRVCEFTSTTDIEKEIYELRDLLKANDPKTAYSRSSKLVKQHIGHAGLYYIHGQIAKRLGYLDEAKNNLLEASAYDCEPWRATAVYNSIIRKVAQNHQAILFDFARLVENDYAENTTFFDDVYAQNLYYEKGMKQLGLVIKAILKL